MARGLREEANGLGSHSGYFLHFLFSLGDVWYPHTDGRHLRKARVLGELDGIVGRYDRYLDALRASWTDPALYVTRRRVDSAPVSGKWRHEWVARGTASVGGRSAAYEAYRQLDVAR